MNLEELLIALGIEEPIKIPSMTTEKLEMDIMIDTPEEVLPAEGVKFVEADNEILIQCP